MYMICETEMSPSFPFTVQEESVSMSRREMMKKKVEDDLPLTRSTPGPPVYYPTGENLSSFTTFFQSSLSKNPVLRLHNTKRT
jgi:hypothetical protein